MTFLPGLATRELPTPSTAIRVYRTTHFDPPRLLVVVSLGRRRKTLEEEEEEVVCDISQRLKIQEMALQSLLSRLPRKGFLGSSSNGVGNMNISDCGSWTSLHKSPLLLPWRISHAKDVKILPSFAPVNYTHQSGNPSQRYQLGGARVLSRQTDNSQRDYLHPPVETLTFINLSLYGAEQLRVYAGYAANHVRGCLVCLSFSEYGEIFAELPGTMIRSDGIIATSASCLSSLKSKGLKVTVDVTIPDTGETYNAVLLDAGPMWWLQAVHLHMGNLFCQNLVMLDVIWAYLQTGGHGQSLKGRLSLPPGIGGCLINSHSGVVGIIHYVHGFEVKATPIELVFKTLEHRTCFQNFGAHRDA